jgi:hypothetical protein
LSASVSGLERDGNLKAREAVEQLNLKAIYPGDSEAKNAELDITAKFKVDQVSWHYKFYSIEALAVAPALST